MEKKAFAGLLAGDVSCWQRFVADYSNFIYAAVIRYSDDHDEKMSIYLFVLEKLRENGFAKLRQFEARSSLSTWLTVVARNLALDFLRGKYGRDFRYKKIVLMPLDERAANCAGLIDRRSPDVVCRQREAAQRRSVLMAELAKAFVFLEKKQVLLIKLVYFQGMKIGDAGRLLGIRAVYKYLRRTLARIRELMLAESPGSAGDLELFLEGEWT